MIRTLARFPGYRAAPSVAPGSDTRTLAGRRSVPHAGGLGPAREALTTPSEPSTHSTPRSVTVESHARGVGSPDNPDLSVRRRCELPGLNRSSDDLAPANASEEDSRLMRPIDRQSLRTPLYGSRRMAVPLERAGVETRPLVPSPPGPRIRLGNGIMSNPAGTSLQWQPRAATTRLGSICRTLPASFVKDNRLGSCRS
jgi:hypothetical protein